VPLTAFASARRALMAHFVKIKSIFVPPIPAPTVAFACDKSIPTSASARRGMSAPTAKPISTNARRSPASMAPPVSMVSTLTRVSAQLPSPGQTARAEFSSAPLRLAYVASATRPPQRLIAHVLLAMGAPLARSSAQPHARLAMKQRHVSPVPTAPCWKAVDCVSPSVLIHDRWATLLR
jgi:hypothetical protein